MLDRKLAHARRQPHRRVAPQRREPGREEHERLGGRRVLILQEPFERLEEPARPAGGSEPVSLPAARWALDGEPHACLVGGEWQRHAAERQRRRDHRLIRGRELGGAARRPRLNVGCARRRTILIDHEDEAPAGIDAGIGAIRRWHARRCSGRSLQRQL
jgi:hypothetical protein